MVGTTAGLGWLLLLSAPLAEPSAASIPSKEQLLFMLEFSDAQGEFIDPFEIQQLPEDTQGLESNEPAAESSNPEGSADANHG